MFLAPFRRYSAQNTTFILQMFAPHPGIAAASKYVLLVSFFTLDMHRTRRFDFALPYLSFRFYCFYQSFHFVLLPFCSLCFALALGCIPSSSYHHFNAFKLLQTAYSPSYSIRPNAAFITPTAPYFGLSHLLVPLLSISI